MIGVLGGTFDPIHYGHLRPAHEVQQRLALESLRLVPAAVPPHRALPVATAAQRLRMVELAVPEFPGLVADDREIRRGGISYTVVTLEGLRHERGAQALCLLLGADAFFGLPTWYSWERLFDLTHFVVMQRPGQPLPVGDALPPWAVRRVCATVDELARRPAGGILFVPVTPRDVSATQLRATMGRGEMPPVDVLPPAVWHYIRSNNIYRNLVN